MKCRNNTENKNPNVTRTKNGRLTFLSKCAVSDIKRIEIYQIARTTGLLSSLGI